MSELRSLLIPILRAHFGEEAAAGFPRLKRIPCTFFSQLLDYFATLDDHHREALLDGMARFGAFHFWAAMPEFLDEAHRQARTENEQREQHPTLSRFEAERNSNRLRGGYRYAPVKMLARIARETKTGGIEGWINSCGYSGLSLQPRPDLLPNSSCLNLVKPSRLRELADTALARVFSPERKKQRGGVWKYEGAFRDNVLTVEIDLGSSWHDQLRYGVSTTNTDGTVTLAGFWYERLWGHHAGWDYLTEENAQRSMDLLAEQIVFVAELSERVTTLRSDSMAP